MCRQVGLDLATRPDSGRPGGALPDGRHRHRRVGADVAARACSPPARPPAPASTAPTVWPATRCSKAWCSARAPPRRCSRPPRAAALQSSDRGWRLGAGDSADARLEPRLASSDPEHSEPRASTAIRDLMWRAAGCSARATVCADAVGAARRGVRAHGVRDRRGQPPDRRRGARFNLVDGRAADRARGAAPRGEPRRPLPRGFSRARRSTLEGPPRGPMQPTSGSDRTCRSTWPNNDKPGLVRHRNHAPLAGLFALVSRRRPPRRAGRLLAGQGLHGHPAVRLRDLGADSAGARRASSRRPGT